MVRRRPISRFTWIDFFLQDFEAGAEPWRQRILFYPGQKDQYHSFNNGSPHRITYNGKEYPTAEHLFQAFKVCRFDLVPRLC
jgi:predicted NAD-dependent protein-ADP-ribosyltransferase YbiA (DUF1768 family)